MKRKELSDLIEKYPEDYNVYSYANTFWDIIGVNEDVDLDIDVLSNGGKGGCIILDLGLEGDWIMKKVFALYVMATAWMKNIPCVKDISTHNKFVSTLKSQFGKRKPQGYKKYLRHGRKWNKLEENKMKKYFLLLFELLFFLIAAIFCFIWYDYKLFIVIFFFLFSSNLMIIRRNTDKGR